MSRKKLKTSFSAESKYEPFYTEGNVEWYQNHLYCQNPNFVAVFNINTGIISSKVCIDESDTADVIHTFCINENRIATSHGSGLIKLWTLEGIFEKAWKSNHNGPIARLVFKTETEGEEFKILASGGSDGNVTIWDYLHQTCRYVLKGLSGVVNLVEFLDDRNAIFGAARDGTILMWNFNDGKLMGCFERHCGVVTSLVFNRNLNHFVSVSRDKAIILWDIQTKASISLIPAYEMIESAVLLPKSFKGLGLEIDEFDQDFYIATGGEDGIVRIWNVSKIKEVYRQTNSLVSVDKEKGLAITKLIYQFNTSNFAVVTCDQNIILHESGNFTCIKQFSGFLDEILDITFMGVNDSHLAIATNSHDIKLYEISTMNCQLLKGHKDLVVTISTSKIKPEYLLSGSKDNTIRLWYLKQGTAICLATGTRHLNSLVSVNFSIAQFGKAATVGEDNCLKIWSIDITSEKTSLYCESTVIAHDKTINCVTYSPNDKIIATGSGDKTTKLWSESLKPIGTLKGHSRGVRCVKFSPVDQVIITSSTDATIKLWSVTSLECLKTIVGHEGSIHKVDFISAGLQILSASSDGLMRLIDVKSSEIVSTLEEHTACIWTFAVNSDESCFVSGGVDSLLITWKDITEEERAEKQQENEALILKEQELSNCVQNKQFLKALRLSLHLKKPSQALQIMKIILKQKKEDQFVVVIQSLMSDEMDQLLNYVKEWNTNSKNCEITSRLLKIILNEILSGRFKPTNLKQFVEETLPYVERTFKNLEKTRQDLYFINYTHSCM